MTGSAPAERSTRDRLVGAAARLFQERGYAATGLAEILALSGAPKGSLYHYFPGGKEDLAIAAAELAGARFRQSLVQEMNDASSTPDLVRRFGARLAGWLDKSGFTQGCPLATLALEQAPHSPALSATLSELFDGWQGVLAGRLEADGLGPARSAELATLILSGLEGALILARVAHNTAPLDRCVTALSSLIAAEITRLAR